MKNALQEVSAGTFKTVLKRIQEKQLVLNANNALKLIVSCCTVCSKKNCEISVKDLCSLFCICCSQIQEPNETQLISYLQSLYYILKYLLENQDLSTLTMLEDSLPPKFLPQCLTEKQSQILICTSNLIYNAALNEVKQAKCVENVTVKASIISLQLYKKAMVASDFLERIYKYIKVFAIPNINFRTFYGFYEKSLNIFTSAFTEKFDLVVKHFLSLIRLLLNIFFETFTTEELQKLVDTSLKVAKEFSSTREHLTLLILTKDISKFISGVPSVTDLQSSYNDFKSTVQLFGITENVFTTCQTISVILMKVCRFYNKNVDKTLKVDVQLILCKILKKAAIYTEKKKIQCSCCENCKLRNSVANSINLLYIVAYLCKHSYSKNERSQQLLKETLSCLEMSCAQIVLLKENGCSAWKTAWMETGCVFYNLGVVLYNTNDSEALSYYHAFVRYLIKLEGIAGSMIKENALHTALLCYTEMCYKTKDYVSAMKMAAFQVLLNPSNSAVPFNQWINAKSAIDDNQNVTIVDMLKLAENDMKILLSDFKIDKEIAENLLIAELEHYKARWPSKIPMMSAFNKLSSFVSVAKSARIFVKIWANSIISVSEELLNVLQNLITDFERTVKKSDFESNIILACLYYCAYKYKTENVVLKNSTDIKKNTTEIKQPLPPYETPLNPNDECDIATLCRHVTCESQMEMKQFLDKCLQIFEQYCNEFKEEHLEFLKSFEIANVLMRIGYEYEMHCYSTNCLRLWKVVQKLVNLMADDVLILKALTGLLQFTEITSEFGAICLNQANNALLVLNNCENTATKWETLANFHITLSQKYLGVENIVNAFEEYQKAQECYAELLAFHQDEIIKAKLCLLDFKFVLLPCNYKLVDHSTTTVVKIHQALKIITNYFNGPGRKLTNAISLLFEITYTIASWYRWLHLPREVRCYTRDVAVLSQQLVSPLRAARFLVVLAHADLLSCRVDSCKSKIFGIATILCLPKQQFEPIIDTDIKKKKKDLEIIDMLSNELVELSLDLPLPKKSPNSPVAIKDTFKFPSFLEHPQACDKYCCNCLEYQELTVMQAHLEGLISLYTHDSSSELQEYFEGALRLLTIFEKRGKDANRFCEIHANVLLDYGNILLKAGQVKYAERINKELLSIVSKKNFSNLYLFNAAQLQKLNVNWNVVSGRNEVTNETEEDEVVATDGTPPKTPEFKFSSVVIVRTPCTNLPSVSHTYSKKKLVFTTTEEATSIKAAKSKTPVRTPKINQPSIKIYPAEAETARKKRPATMNKIKSKEPNSNAVAVESAVIDFNSEKLRSKTKLLTAKIKKEAQEEKKSTRVRKNLMSELATSNSTTAAEGRVTERKGVTTRKSSRNPKI